MTYKFIFIIPLIVGSVYFCNAQKNFSEGYIINLNNDTIHGKIKDSKSTFELNRKAIKIHFIDSSGKEESFLATKLKGYSKAGISNYKSLTDLNEGPFFAKIIIQGPLTMLVESEWDYQSMSTRLFLVHINNIGT